jgi:hypothetical protein
MSSDPVVAEVVEPVVEAVAVNDHGPVVEARVAEPAVVVASVVPPVVTATPVEWLGVRGFLRWGWFRFRGACEWLFGAASLTVGLAILAAIPVAQFLTLGYLLEAAARVGRTGRLRDGFPGVRQAARVGSIILGVWVTLLPLRVVADLWASAELIDPGGPVARRWRLGLTALTVILVLHIVIACSRGGKLRHFFWPFTNAIWLVKRLAAGGYYAAARDAVWDFVVSLRLPYYFWLGLRGFAGALLWLAVPVTLFAVARLLPLHGKPEQVAGVRFLIGLFGGVQMACVVLLLPFLQVQFAVRNRFRAFLDVRGVCVQFWRAPWAFAVAFFFTLLFALPLYLLKIEMIPRETAWLPSLVFLVFMFPARLLAGWAYGRARRRSTGRHWLFGVTGALVMLPVAGFYVLVVFFTQYTGWNGIWSLYEQHAFLLPVPFMGM